MKVTASWKFIGAEARPGFKDPSKMVYVVGFGSGLDSLRIYVDPMVYADACKLEPYSDVEVELDFNPVTNRMSFTCFLSVE